MTLLQPQTHPARLGTKDAEALIRRRAASGGGVGASASWRPPLSPRAVAGLSLRASTERPPE